MNPTQLKTFLAVAELRHFARAASVCNLSQPAVSHQIAELEADVGAKLLNRAPRRVSLTVAGEVMQEEARRILAAIDRARERMQEVTSGAMGRIRLGATPTAGLYLLPPLVAEYRAAHPAFDFQFHVAASVDICDRVVRNDLDLAVITGHPPTAELRAKAIARDEFVLIAPPGPAKHLTRDALPRECWIMREEKSTTRKAVDAWLQRHAMTPQRTMTLDGPDAVKRAVIAGLGISIVSRLTVEEELAAGRVAAVEMGLTLPSREVFVVDHPQKHHGAACTAMLQMLSERYPRDER